MSDRLKLILALVALAGTLATIGGVYVKGRSDGGRLAEAEAGKNALNRIRKLETNNANFKALDDRGRCLVFMRDSGLPDSACD